ncbi:site-specific DNA-methyltransferase [Patescibacteria group bacterium]|nr:site-specific DNA-methyltransferase [Patescibacteria group bacterium]
MENNQTKEKLLAEIERLKKELKKKKKYGLVWEDKPEDVVEMCKEKLPVLKEVKGKEIITDKNKPVNLLIEGDNYHALSVLNYTHKGKIDVIYIDPPYNTGNKDFKYNDNFVDREDSYRHSKWLSFMGKRLKLAQKLLKNTGVIFISIDDNEVAQLRLLCDDVFGEENFVAQVTWHRKRGKDNSAKYLSKVHEYVLIYGKNNKSLNFNKIDLSEQTLTQYTNADNDSRGRYRKLALWRRGGQGGSKSFSFTTKEKDFIPARSWLVNEETMNRLDQENKLVVVGKGLYRKLFLEEHGGSIPETIWLDVSNTANATDMLKDLFGKSEFETPKPIELLERVLKIGGSKNSVILDFMAGSGTTGHAVLELNKEDGGNRKFILCTNNELNGLEKELREKGMKENEIQEHGICRRVCYPRIEKVINGYKTPKGEKVEALGGNLKYFKTDFVDYKEANDKNKIKLTKEAAEMLCVKEGTFELIQDNGDFKIFKNHNHYTGIIFDQLAIKDFKKVIENISAKGGSASGGKNKFSVYIFSLGDDSFDEEFEDIKSKVKLSPIPEAILKVYRRIFK